jgi:hypothetical protein
MVNCKTSIKPIYIQNHDVYKYVCEINTQSGTIIEKERTEGSHIETWRGCYKNTDTGFIGVFASDIGPVLFINQDTYALIKDDYDIELIKKGKNLKKREFTFCYKEKEIYRTEYDEVICYYANPYEEDEVFRDFFVWMYKNKTDENFYRYYTYSEIDFMRIDDVFNM